jgi:hypothetical protein
MLGLSAAGVAVEKKPKIRKSKEVRIRLFIEKFI